MFFGQPNYGGAFGSAQMTPLAQLMGQVPADLLLQMFGQGGAGSQDMLLPGAGPRWTPDTGWTTKGMDQGIFNSPLLNSLSGGMAVPYMPYVDPTMLRNRRLTNFTPFIQT